MSRNSLISGGDMTQSIQASDDARYVVLQNISIPISYSEDRVQYLKDYLKGYDERNLFEVELKDTYDMFKFADFKLSSGAQRDSRIAGYQKKKSKLRNRIFYRDQN